MINQKKNSLDILTTSPLYFYKKHTGTRNENLYFDIGSESVNREVSVRRGLTAEQISTFSFSVTIP